MRTIQKNRYFIFLIPLFVGLGCSFSTQYQAPSILPPPPSPTPEICSDNPSGLWIQVLLGRRDQEGQRITVKGMGFVPGEKLTIRVEGQGPEHGFKIETLDYPVKPEGTFSVADTLPLDDPMMHWEVHVIHQQGIACLRFTTVR